MQSLCDHFADDYRGCKQRRGETWNIRITDGDIFR